MDLTPYIGAIVTVVVAITGGYVAMKNAMTAQLQELKVDLARLEQKVDDQSERVERHNQVVDRTIALEADMKTAFKHIDNLRERDEKIEAKIEKLHE